MSNQLSSKMRNQLIIVHLRQNTLFSICSFRSGFVPLRRRWLIVISPGIYSVGQTHPHGCCCCCVWLSHKRLTLQIHYVRNCENPRSKFSCIVFFFRLSASGECEVRCNTGRFEKHKQQSGQHVLSTGDCSGLRLSARIRITNSPHLFG